MWIQFCGYLLVVIIPLKSSSVEAKWYPIFPKKDPQTLESDASRFKRQFGFQPPAGFQRQDDLNGNGIFFDNDNVFNDFIQPNRGRNNWGRTTQRPQGFTTVAVPGMGTTQSACEDRCRTTPQYDPVCGDNNVTYMNIARYRCAVNCGKNVRIAAYRACPRV